MQEIMKYLHMKNENENCFKYIDNSWKFFYVYNESIGKTGIVEKDN